jgi:XTP/dITP diphosphohydrolase
MTALLIASTNVGKLREIEAIFAGTLVKGLDLKLVLPVQIGIQLDVEEDGSTYAENAAKKALAYTQASRLVTLADDSGLEVDALHGQPGLHSARYAPWPGATDADRRRLLLQNLQGKPRPWTAHFHCTVAIAVPGGAVFYAEGEQTMAELPMEKKNQLSHRAQAVQAAAPMIEKVFRGSV